MKSARIVNPAGLGEVLRASRILRGTTQRQLARDLGISQRYIVEFEQGKPTKALERLFDIMQETGVTLYADIDVEHDQS